MRQFPLHHDAGRCEDRLFYGYRLRTDVTLPSLPLMPMDGVPDLTLCRGVVPSCFPEASWTSPFVEIGSDDRTVLVRIGDTVRFLVRDGSRIVLDQDSQPETSTVETFLFGAVAGIVLHQRGVLPLHASCVMIGDVAVALAGVSGRGKSTLAGALSMHGHPVVTDDVCPIEFRGKVAMAIPGPARIRLWPDSADHLGVPPDRLQTGRPGHPKRVLSAAARSTPSPLGAVIRIAVDKRLDRPVMHRLTGPATMTPMEELVYRTRLGRRLGRRLGLFQDLVRLAGMVPIFQLIRPEGTANLPQLIDLVRSTVPAGT